MKIVHINCNAAPIGGASIAMLRLHEALLKNGVESLVVCPYDPVVPESLQWPQGVRKRVVQFLSKAQNAVLKLFYGRAYTINFIPRGIASYVNRLHPDIVHLHWLGADTISLEEIRKIKAPVVWSLHDLWPMLGVDAYPKNNWYKSGYPKTALWVDRWVWSRKRAAIKTSRISPIVASQWLLGEAKASLAFAGQAAYYVPLALDASFFEGGEPLSLANSDKGKFTVLFGATGGTGNSIKGFDRLIGALDYLGAEAKANLRIVVFGTAEQDLRVSDVPVHFVGKVASDALIPVYQAADVFAFPSRYETCGQVKLEALACGLPVIAFDEAACAEEIVHQKTGWVAQAGNLADFAKGIEWAYALWSAPTKLEKCAGAARASMAQAHTPKGVAQSLINVYTRVLETSGRTP